MCVHVNVCTVYMYDILHVCMCVCMYAYLASMHICNDHVCDHNVCTVSHIYCIWVFSLCLHVSYCLCVITIATLSAMGCTFCDLALDCNSWLWSWIWSFTNTHLGRDTCNCLQLYIKIYSIIKEYSRLAFMQACSCYSYTLSCVYVCSLQIVVYSCTNWSVNS